MALELFVVSARTNKRHHHHQNHPCPRLADSRKSFVQVEAHPPWAPVDSSRVVIKQGLHVLDEILVVCGDSLVQQLSIAFIAEFIIV
jgi:hypothetical protein